MRLSILLATLSYCESAVLTTIPDASLRVALEKRDTACMVLSGSTACPGQNGLVIAQTSVYTDTTSFDAFVNSRLDNNTAYVQAFQKNFGCPEYKGQGQQYHLSMFCALLTQKPSGCSQQDSKPRIPLCGDTCNAAASSLSTFYQTVCTSNQSSSALNERNLTINTYQNFCSSLTIKNSQTGQCLNGSTQPQEARTCGFSSVEQGKSFCSISANSGNPCCLQVPGVSTTVTSSTATATSASSSSTSSLTSTATSSPDSSSGNGSGFSSSAIFIVLLAIGILFFLIMLFLFFRWAMARRQEDDLEEEDDDKPDTTEMPGMSERPTSFVDQSKKYNSQPPPPPAFIPPTQSELDMVTVQVIAPYASRMVDELTLNVGDQIQVFESYDDGWSYGRKIETGEVGTFPQICTVGNPGRMSVRMSTNSGRLSAMSGSRMSQTYSQQPSTNLSQYTMSNMSSSYIPPSVGEEPDSADLAFDEY